MRYENNDRLRGYLRQAATGGHLQHIEHPAFDLEDAAFWRVLQDILWQHPSMEIEGAALTSYLGTEVSDRAAFRCLTLGAEPEIAVPLPKPWFRVKTWVRATSIASWPWLKIGWAVAVLLLSAIAAFAGPEPNQGIRNATRGFSLVPQITGGRGGITPGGLIVRLQNASMTLATMAGGQLTLNCTTNMTCSWSGNTFTITSAGGAGGVTSLNALTGAVTLSAGANITLTPVGNDISIASTGGGGTPCTVTALSLQFNNAGAFGCVTEFTYTSGTKTIAGLAGGILDLGAAASFKVPAAAGCVPTVSALACYDTTANKWVFGQNGATVSFAMTGTGCTNQFVTATSATAAPTCTTATLASAQFANQGTTTTLLHGNGAGNPSFGAVVSADMNITTTGCTNQFVTAISAGGVGTCTTDTLASAQHANQGTTTTVLHGNGAGNPSFGAVVSADLNITTSTCTNQFLTAISAAVAGTCTTATLASAQFANQGTTTTLLHGNGAGNPTFAAVNLATAEVTGTLPAANVASIPLNQVISPTGAIATFANGDNALTMNTATTTASRVGSTFGETTASTSTGTPYGLRATTLIGSTASPFKADNSLNGSQALCTVCILPTWNTTGVVPGALFVNVTNTASGASSLLADFQVGSTSQFKVDKAGIGSFVTSVGTGTQPACTVGTAGALCQTEGTAPTAASAVGQIYTDSTLHDLAIQTNGGAASAGSGIIEHNVAFLSKTAQTASIATATLCASTTGLCNQIGQYRIDWNFFSTGTACTVVTAGGVTFTLAWTDKNTTAHTHVMPMIGEGAAATAPLSTSTFFFQTTHANAFASGTANISTNGAVIQYATTYTACTTGTGQYQLEMSVTRLA